MQRRLFFGVAMVCAFGSIYAGLFGLKVAQYFLIAASVVVLLVAMVSAAPPDTRPRP